MHHHHCAGPRVRFGFNAVGRGSSIARFEYLDCSLGGREYRARRSPLFILLIKPCSLRESIVILMSRTIGSLQW